MDKQNSSSEMTPEEFVNKLIETVTKLMEASAPIIKEKIDEITNSTEKEKE